MNRVKNCVFLVRKWSFTTFNIVNIRKMWEKTRSMTRKKVIRNFYPENGNFSPKKVIQKSWVAKIFLVPPKLGARSPPLVFRSSFLFLCHWILACFFYTTEVSAPIHSNPFFNTVGLGLALVSTNLWSQRRSRGAHGAEISIQFLPWPGFAPQTSLTWQSKAQSLAHEQPTVSTSQN